MSKIVMPESLSSVIRNLISSKKQFNDSYIDITVNAVFRLKTGANLDFGGSEFEAGQTEPCVPSKEHPQDEYGWWHLHYGYFLLEYNEEIKLGGGQIGILEPHPHLLAGGCYHPTLTFSEIPAEYAVPLWVPKFGLKLKQNARVSRILVLDI